MRCIKTRWAISRAADDGGPLADRARRHVERCRDCEAFERRTEWLGRTLAKASDSAPPPPARARLPRHLAAAGLVAASAVAVILVVGDSDPPPRSAPAAVADRTEDPEPSPATLDVRSLAADAEGGIRYVLKVSGLPAP